MSLKRETVKISFLTGLSILGGILFNVLLARRFGVSWQMDCFFVILALFGWLGVLNTFITALYLPVFNEVKKGGVKESLIFIDVVIKWVLLLSVLIVIFILIFNRPIIKIFAPGFNERNIVLCMEINTIIITALIFYNISQLIQITLDALYFYTVTALTTLIDPVFNIAAIFFLAPVIGIKGIAISYFASNFMRAIILLLYLRFKTGWRITRRFSHNQLSTLISNSSRMAFNGFIWGAKDVIIRNVASRLGEGTVTLFSYAEKFINILVQVVINPLARVFYSRVSEWLTLSRWEDIKFLLIRTTRVSMALSLSISSVFLVFLPSFLHLFFWRSKFTNQDIARLSLILYIMLAYFIILSFEFYLSRIIFAAKRIGIVFINVLSGLATLCIAVGLTKDSGVYGLALSIVFAQMVVCALYCLFTGKIVGFSLAKLSGKFLKPFLLASIFSILGMVARNSISNHLIFILFFFPFWIICYAIAARVFLKEEIKILLSK